MEGPLIVKKFFKHYGKYLNPVKTPSAADVKTWEGLKDCNFSIPQKYTEMRHYVGFEMRNVKLFNHTYN